MASEPKGTSRRTFLGASVAALAAGKAEAAVPSWTRDLGAGVAAAPYGSPSRHEAHVVRRMIPWLQPAPETSVSFTPLADLHGIITPNGVHFERHHAGTPDIDPAGHKLILHGLVERPLVLTVADVLRFPQVSRIHFIECPANTGLEWRGAQMERLQYTHGMISCCEWTGVPLKLILDHIGLKPKAAWVLAEGADGAAMTRSIPLAKCLDDALIVYAQNGEMLRPEQGYPLRLVVPGYEGNMNVKWLRRLEVGDAPWHHREESARYTDLMPDGRARRFAWQMDVKSVITSPCPERPVNGKGFVEIRGLAWSGAGTIKRVDVSVDGGRNWTTAQVHGPVLPKSLTRFTLPWQWTGEPALLQSRAMDQAGAVQPTLDQLRAVRGVWSLYRNNSIQTWALGKDGEVENVQVS